MRPYTIADHIVCAFLDQAHAYACNVCGLKTEQTTGPIHWLIWFCHDLTVGWGRKHWVGYRW